MAGAGPSVTPPPLRRLLFPIALGILTLRAPAAQPQMKDTPEAHLGLGYDALRQDRYAAAVIEFREALRLDGTLTMRARFPLAVALFEMKQTDEARREFEAVGREVGEHPNISYYLGRLDLLDQNYAAAVRHLTQAAAKPPFPDTSYYLGLACLKRGDLAAAERWLKQAAQANPRDNLARYQLAMVYRKQGRGEDAKKAFAESSELRQRDTADSEVRTQCAQMLDSSPREAARAYCQRLYDPDNAERLTALGTLYGQHGDLEAALEPLRRAAKLAPEGPQVQYNLAFTYYQLAMFDQARDAVAKAVERWPDIAQLNFLYGAVLAKLGDYAAAYQSLGRAHQLNARDAGAAELLYRVTLVLARNSADGRQFAEALRYFGEAANLRPADAEPHQGMAQVYAATGHPEEAAAQQRLAENAR